MNTHFRQAIIERKLLIGSWVQINHPTSGEVLANTGYDWIGVDLEHSDIDTVSFTALLRSIYGRGPAVLARVQSNDVMEIRRALDVGADGVIVPLVSTAEEARQAVQAAKYPPQGIRGFCFSRMNNWGIGFEEYVRQANDNTVVIVMIESKEGVDNIEEIISIDGVDGVFIGPYDMTGSYGIPGKTSDPIIRKACLRVAQTCQTIGKSAGLHVVQVDDTSLQHALEDGFTFICLGGDVIFLNEAARNARQAILTKLNEKEK